MGFQTTMVIQNDALHTIDEDPVGWWAVARQNIMSHFGAIPARFGFKSHANGFTVASMHHADVTTVLVVGQNDAQVLGQFYEQEFHTEEGRLELLKKLAKDMGYSLKKLPVKKSIPK